jgi:hypothetical protein
MYLRREAGHPSFVVPRDVTKMKWLTFALVAADFKPSVIRYPKGQKNTYIVAISRLC